MGRGLRGALAADGHGGAAPNDAAGKLAAHHARTAHAARGLAADARARVLPTLLHLAAVRALGADPDGERLAYTFWERTLQGLRKPRVGARIAPRGATAMIGPLVTLITVATTPAAGDAPVATVPRDLGRYPGFRQRWTHVRYAAFALDFVPAQPKTTPAPRRGAPLTAFACYGRPVLAPADGTVVRANGDARDWPAYRKGSDPGNYVIIQHAPANTPSSATSPPIRSSWRRVRACAVATSSAAAATRGNAGMPHLHIGFLSAIDPITTRPMRFSDYERAGADEAWHPGTGFPVKDELLRPLRRFGP